jgi:hypothetical protein
MNEFKLRGHNASANKESMRGIVAVGVALALLAVFAALIGLIPLSSP